MLVESAAEVVGDVVLSVGKRTRASKAAHNGAAFALDAGLYLVAVNGAVAFFQTVTRLNDRHAHSRILLRKLIGGKNSAGTGADNDDIVFHNHSSCIGCPQHYSGKYLI